MTAMWRTASFSKGKRMTDWSTSAHLSGNYVNCRWGFGEWLRDVLFKVCFLFNDALNTSVYMASVIDEWLKEYAALGEGYWHEEPEVLEENPIPVPQSPKITQGFVWQRTWVCKVRDCTTRYSQVWYILNWCWCDGTSQQQGSWPVFTAT